MLLFTYAIILIIAGIVNTFTEALLTKLCYISWVWHIVGTLLIVICMLAYAPKLQPASFVFFHYENDTGIDSQPYVCLIGCLFAASTFTGYDTAAHVAEETTDAHASTPWGMILACINCFILGIILILGLNFSIQDFEALLNTDDTATDDGNAALPAYTILWQGLVGKPLTMFFLFINFVAFECSNCANLTSASRMIYAFARDAALPGSKYLYHMSDTYNCPFRSIWLCVLIAFCLALPGKFSLFLFFFLLAMLMMMFTVM